MLMARARKYDFRAMDALEDGLKNILEFQVPPGGDIDEGPILGEDEAKDALFEFMERWWRDHSDSWMRVTQGAEIVIREACDPAKSYLDWKPGLLTSGNVEKQSS